jgi:predicted alpha/beta hydrolase
MVGNKDLIERLMTVTSQSAYWKYAHGGTLSHFRWYLFWLLAVPVLTWYYGYFPAKKIGMFDDIPANAMLEVRE